MNNENITPANTPEYPREIYEPILTRFMDLDECLKQELTLSYLDLDGPHGLQTCYGDIKKTIDALMDYAMLLDTVCEQWDLGGFHRATYEYHSAKLREIAGKLQHAIGYDYDVALEKCRKKRWRKERDEDVGEDAMTLAVRRRNEPKAKKDNPPPAGGSIPSSAEKETSLWEDVN